ncbi:MAG TPA: PAS domain-containing protein, partial [Acidobacteriota bacterium]|nr:PAS domain-containing protein [Acidobacteriota bacterium]
MTLAHIGTWNWDAQTDAVTGSCELRRLFGLAPGQRVPNFAAQKGTVYPEESWHRLHAAMRETLRTGESFEIDVEARCNSTPIWVTSCAEPWRAANGRTVGLRGTVQEITHFKRAQAALRDSESRERERAAELTALLELVPAPVFIAHDPACRHITGNRPAEELLKIPRGAEASLGAAEEMRPQHFKGFKDGRELRLDELPAQVAARGTALSNFEFDLVFADGNVRHVLAYATPLWAGAEPRGSVSVMLDITERKRLEAALRAREAQLRSFVQHAPVAMCMLDRGMNYVAASERWITEYGRGNPHCEGLNHYALFPDIPERWRTINRAALEGKDQFANEDLWEQPDGTRFWLRWAVRPWLAPDGSVGGIIIMVENT